MSFRWAFYLACVLVVACGRQPEPAQTSANAGVMAPPAPEVQRKPQAEIDWSRRIIAAHAEAAKQGRGIVVVDGKLIENLHVLNARRVVELADAIAAKDRAEQDRTKAAQ